MKTPSANLPKVSIDREKIRTVLVGILDNAIRYTNKGTITVRIESKKGGGVIISVKDTGKGLAATEQETIFQSFRRGKTAQSLWTEGVGLSLYIAKQLIEAHGGRIWAESPGENQGTTFYIELPLSS